jgi:hypothetical protein
MKNVTVTTATSKTSEGTGDIPVEGKDTDVLLVKCVQLNKEWQFTMDKVLPKV